MTKTEIESISKSVKEK